MSNKLLQLRDELLTLNEDLNKELGDIQKNAKGEGGFNKAALKRTRALTLKIAKVSKEYRQVSLSI